MTPVQRVAFIKLAADLPGLIFQPVILEPAVPSRGKLKSAPPSIFTAVKKGSRRSTRMRIEKWV
jgi:hypothetical protein